MKYYLIAGEASGDLHGSNLLKEIKLLDKHAEFRAWGGDLMAEQGADIQKHYRELAFMGFTEVILNLRTILGNLKKCEDDVVEWNPDVVILIDYPGFNLRLAKALKENGLKIFYYISPQVWAWKESRVKKIKEYVDKMYVILPFEKEFYQKHQYEVEFVGHPLLDAINDLPELDESGFKQNHSLSHLPIIVLLPGSRKQEIKKMLPLMIAAGKKFENYQLVIAGAPSQNKAFYDEVMKADKVPVLFNETYNLMRLASVGLVTSGTATLEAALLDLPQVVCYKGGTISYLIARSLVNIKYISLVNLIMNREVVKELIQDDMTINKMEFELNKILPGELGNKQLKTNYSLLREKLGGSGASEHTAVSMLKTLRSKE